MILIIRPLDLTYGRVQKLFLSTYDGLSGLRANKTAFDLKYEGTPIYSKTFNPVGINSGTDGVGLVKTTGVLIYQIISSIQMKN